MVLVASDDRTVRSAPPSRARLGTVDFWRGFVLCTIFVNHIPGNLFERLTYRNFGFSDSAEAFVFMSGFAVALAHGRRLARGETLPIVAGLGRRIVKTYGVHVALSLAGIAIFAIGAAIFDDAGLMDVHGRDLVVDDPWVALVGLVSLGHQFGYFNILPLYVLLLAFAPVLLLLARKGVATMLGASLALYGVTRLTGLNIPTWPMRGEWFFDPFAWQLLMAVGIACGLGVLHPGLRPRLAPTVLAALVLAACAFCATDGFGTRPGLFDLMRGTADLDKTSLGLGRLVHFLCLAYLVWSLRLAQVVQATPLFRPLCLLGRHGLSVFVALSLLAALGQVLTGGLGHSAALDAALVAGGLALLYGWARLAEHHGVRKPLPAALGYASSPGHTTL